VDSLTRLKATRLYVSKRYIYQEHWLATLHGLFYVRYLQSRLCLIIPRLLGVADFEGFEKRGVYHAGYAEQPE
jgi:hypothetical protein